MTNGQRQQDRCQAETQIESLLDKSRDAQLADVWPRVCPFRFWVQKRGRGPFSLAQAFYAWGDGATPPSSFFVRPPLGGRVSPCRVKEYGVSLPTPPLAEFTPNSPHPESLGQRILLVHADQGVEFGERH